MIAKNKKDKNKTKEKGALSSSYPPSKWRSSVLPPPPPR